MGNAEKQAKVTCRGLPNGIILRLFKIQRNEIAGPWLMETGRMELRPGVNDVDAEFMSAWIRDNADHDLMTRKLIEVEFTEAEKEA